MKITEALLAEHIVFHNLLDHIEEAIPNLNTLGEVRSLARLLEAVLESHSATEETLVFEPLADCLEQMGQSKLFEEEHQEIGKSLILAQQAARMKQARQLLLDAVVSSRNHFDKEERLVLPLAEKVLKRETLHELGRTWMQRRNVEF